MLYTGGMQVGRFRLGNSVQPEAQDLLRHHWLCLSWNCLGQVIWAWCWYVVCWSFGLWTDNRTASILSPKQTGNLPQDLRSNSFFPQLHVQRSHRFYWEFVEKSTWIEDEFNWCFGAPISCEVCLNRLIYKFYYFNLYQASPMLSWLLCMPIISINSKEVQYIWHFHFQQPI